jgi:hypothetical protein
MALLDHFRAQPRQKHPDPTVRLAFVQEISIEDRDVIAEIARDDPDARVRRAAVAKLMDPPALAAVAASDPDESVRADAVAMLREIALDAFEGLTEVVSVAAVDAIADARVLATIAKTAAREPIAMRALARIEDGRLLGSIARHAPLESIRCAAFERVSDPSEILHVALNSDFKDTGVAAVERSFDRLRDLEQIATRARNKSAAKRARTMLREIEERAAAVAAEERLAEEAAKTAQATADSEAARVEAERRAAAEREQAAEAARRLEETRAEEWQRHQDAERDAREKADAERRKDQERRLNRLAELADQAAAAAAIDDLSLASRRLDIVKREWRDVSAGVTVDPAIAERYASAQALIDTRGRDADAQAVRARQEGLAHVRQLLARVEPMAARGDFTLKAGERALRDLRTMLADVPPLPSRQEYDAVTHRLKAAQAALIPKVQEFRDAADWQRWANVGVQEQLCQKMEALAALDDAEQIAREVRALQEQWKQAADAPRAQGETLWRRFKTAHDAAWGRCEAHFAEQARQRAEHLAKKTALIERVEALADSTNWVETAEEIKRLQAEWKAIGPVARGQERATWERFRAACDRFFTRRQNDLADRKKVWAENLAKKEALCVNVEALADSTDWEPAAAEIRRIQAEWKTIGPVKKSRSEALWQRFRAACDKFFARYAQRHEIARADRIAAREAICVELETLVPDSPADPPADLIAQVRAIRSRWQQEISARGVDRDRAIQLDVRFQAAFNRVLATYSSAFAGTELDVDANRKRMEALVKRVEDLANSIAGPADAGANDAALSPTVRLAAMLKEALAANTIGGKVGESSRLNAAADDIRNAQASWAKLGPVAEDIRRPLAARFERASRRITDRVRQTGGASSRPARPVGAGR